MAAKIASSSNGLKYSAASPAVSPGQSRTSVTDDRVLASFQHPLPSDLVLRILRQKDISRGGARRHKAVQADQTSLQAAWEGFQPGCRVGNRARDHKYFCARR